MTHNYFLTQLTGRDSHLRAADADREETAERLRKSHAEGRLDMAEFQERLELCYQAKTMGQLGELVSDLPRHDARADHRSSGWATPWRLRLAPLAPILFVFLLISAVSGHHHATWLWIPLVFLFWRMFWWRRRRWYTGSE